MSCGNCPCCLGTYKPKIMDPHEALFERFLFLKKQPDWNPQGSWIGLAQNHEPIFGNTEAEVIRLLETFTTGPAIYQPLFDREVRHV